MKQQTVLLLGNDPDDVRLIGDSLLGLPEEAYRLDQVDDVDEALDRLAEEHVDLLFYDMSMPGAAELEFLTRIVEIDPRLPVVVLSNVDDPTVAAEAVSRGAQDYLIRNRINPGVIVRVARYAIERNRILSGLRDLDQVKSQFVSTVSHEMRTPLTIIREFVSLVRDGVAGPLNDEQSECLDSALRNCDRLSALVEDLLDLSQIESGKLRLCRVETDLAAILRQCHHDFLPKFKSKDQRLELALEEDLRAVLCDPAKILQVVVNLVGNAHKFTAAGGHIALRARTDANRAVVEVEDDGVGISADDQLRIFEAFTQIGRRNEADSEGTGLGLTISKNIVQLHGGTMEVDSTPGKGSRFVFTLPPYAEGAELEAFVVDRTRLYRTRRKTVSMVLLGVVAASAADTAPLRHLRELEERVADWLRGRRDEVLMVESKSLLACLIESDAHGGHVALRRLVKLLEDTGAPLDCFEFALWEHRSTDSAEFDLDDVTFEPLAAFAERTPRKRVMVVDDDDTVLQMIGDMLSSSGLNLNLLLTTSGYEACVRYGAFRPDLVLLDIHMPGLDGRDVLRSMVQARTGDTKFMAVSGDPTSFEEMSRLGCDECLDKPFETRALIDKAARLLGLEIEADEPVCVES